MGAVFSPGNDKKHLELRQLDERVVSDRSDEPVWGGSRELHQAAAAPAGREDEAEPFTHISCLEKKEEGGAIFWMHGSDKARGVNKKKKKNEKKKEDVSVLCRLTLIPAFCAD